MEVINDIYRYSAMAQLSKWHQRAAIILFICIVAMLIIMLFTIFLEGHRLRFSFGY